MGLRDRLDQRRHEREVFGPHGTATRFHVPQHLLADGSEAWVEGDAGDRAFRVCPDQSRSDGGVVLEDVQGTTLCRIGSKELVLRDSMQVDDPDGEYLAIVHRTFLSEVRQRWYVSLPGVAKWEIHGSVHRHEYELRLDGRTIAQVSKKGARGKGTYAVDVAPGESAALLLAVAVAAEGIEHPAQ